MDTKILLAAIFLLFSMSSSLSTARVFDVRNYGIAANGDITQAVQKSFREACDSTVPSRVLIPSGVFTLGEIVLQGPCKAPQEFQVLGTVMAPANPAVFKTDGWITFNYIDRFHLYGGGTFDGQGSSAWKLNNCSKDPHCPKLAVNLRFNFITNALVKHVTTKDSKNFHVNVLGCKNFRFDHFTVAAPHDSINTDGIHIGKSTGVNITDTNIMTGDDCISVGDGSKDIYVTRVNCGPGHGISIGSLGRTPNEEPVNGFYVKNCTFWNTENGIRVKTWPNSLPGVITQIHYEDIRMVEVANPVIIDQEYCPYNLCDKSKPSLVRISDVSFQNIYGTSTTPVTMKILCSSSVPCQNVNIGHIFLVNKGTGGPAVSACSNVHPILSSQQVPPACTVPANFFLNKIKYNSDSKVRRSF